MEGQQTTRRKPMPDGEYRECQAALLELARTALLMPDLELFLRRIVMAPPEGIAVGPGGAWLRRPDLHAIWDLARAAQTLQFCARRQAGRSG